MSSPSSLPTKKIKEGYHSLIVETTNGEEYSGILLPPLSELDLLDAANQIASIPKQNIANRTIGGIPYAGRPH